MNDPGYEAGQQAFREGKSVREAGDPNTQGMAGWLDALADTVRGLAKKDFDDWAEEVSAAEKAEVYKDE
jgi:hypothetical protein